ncbi:DNA-binding protein [Hesseltinella vesiculosa]|uniref:DNA-binding protein n=1 Tax=Hesseltinella vesiculosa TaxID=101127 RepID=A0A1X2GCL7_9FUNG|nr:DNA-binding protein [Hesseltinella vesiculosa]
MFDAVDTLCEFLQVWIHQVLYQRDIYPKDSFELRNQYDVPAAMSIHPDVCQYISRFVTSVRPMIEKETCQLVSVVVLTSDNKVLERHVCQLTYSLATTDQQENAQATVFQYFRATLLKLNSLSSSLPMPSLPLYPTFRLTMELAQHADHPLKQDKFCTYWMPEDQQPPTRIDGQGQLLPVKTITIPSIKINLFVTTDNQDLTIKK